MRPCRWGVAGRGAAERQLGQAPGDQRAHAARPRDLERPAEAVGRHRRAGLRVCHLDGAADVHGRGEVRQLAGTHRQFLGARRLALRRFAIERRRLGRRATAIGKARDLLATYR